MTVAHGAAVLAAKLNGIQEPKVKTISLSDVCPLSIGVEVLGGSLFVTIPRNTSLTTVQIVSNYVTASDWQTSAKIKVYEGEQRMARDNHWVGEFRLSNIPPKKSDEEGFNEIGRASCRERV